MRQVICFVVAAAMFGGGLYIIWDEIFVASAIMVRVIGVGITLALVGGMWLWADFGEPLSRLLSRGSEGDAPPSDPS